MGDRLDVVVARTTGLSRAAAARLVDDGRVTVDGRRRPKSHRVEPGEHVEVEQREQAPADVPPAQFEVVHEDEYLLVIDKPAGVVVHPGAGHASGTLAQALEGIAAGGPDPERAGIVHRLDRDTSGLMLVARSEEVHRALRHMIAARDVSREYLALVSGRPDAQSGTIDAPLGRDRARRTVVSTRSDRARRAVTHFRVLEELARTALLGVRLETGRTHQIRAHLAEIGHAVCGDRRYGGGACGDRLGLSRQYLHACALVFRHPFSGEDLACESKPPVDLRRALDAARREPASGGPDGG